MVRFQKCDQVVLSIGNTLVGGGTLHEILPEDIFHGVTLGDNLVAVFVEDAFDWNYDLSYPTKHLKTLGDAVDYVVLWDRGDVNLVKVPEVAVPEDAHLAIPYSQGAHHQSDVHLSIPDSQQTHHGEDDQTGPEDVPLEHVLQFASGRRGGETKCQLPHTSTSANTTNSTFCPTDGDVDGNEVDLFISGCKVARGIVHHVDASMTCHNILIGEENISVRIIEVDEEHETDSLPFFHARAHTLEVTIGVPCRCAKLNIPKVEGTGASGRVMDEEFEGTDATTKGKEHNEEEDEDYTNVDETTQGKEHIFDEGVDYTKRRYWYLKEVKLYCPQRELVVGEGIISVHLPTGAVDDKELGAANVGITLMVAHHKDYFPSYGGLGSLPSLAWPIDFVQLVHDGRFLGDIIKDASYDSDDDIHV